MLIIDTHVHAGRNWFEPIESLEFQMDKNGVDHAVLIQHGGTYDNDYLFDESAKRPRRFKVAVLIDPASEDPIGELERCAERGAAGVRIAPDGEFLHARKSSMWRSAGQLGLVVTSLGDARRFASPDFARLVDSCPDTSIVIEHLAGVGITDPPYTEYETALKLAERDNTTIKVPGLGEICPRPPQLTPEFKFDDVQPLFEMAKDAFGVERMMWGSDWPPSAGREGYRNTLAGVMQHPAFAGEGELAQVMGLTAQRVWGF